MAQRLVLSIVLQDIIKNREGMPASGYWMYFYDKKSPTTLRSAYYKNQEGNVVPAPNPLQLDENGALPHKLYYFVDVDDPEDRYTVELKCCYGNAAAPELIFQDLPYFQEQAKADPVTAIMSDNLFIDGQFNIGLQINDRGQGAGFVLPTFSQLPIAGLAWQFLRPYADSVRVQNRVDIDRIFIKEINEAEKISEGNPRFYLNVVCEKFSEKNPPLQKIVAFRSSNVLWGANTSIQLKFYAWKSGDNIPITVSVMRNFGLKSSTVPQVIQIAEYTIDSDVPKVYFTNFALPAVIIPKDIGDDQYLLVQFSLPKNQRFDFRATNFYCAEVSSPVSVVDFKYPVRNADLAKSDLLFSSFLPNKYGIHDSYKKLIFTIGGLKFADDIGEIVRYPKGAKVDEKKTNLIKCDGRMLDANGISPLGIEYKRLYEKLGCTPSTFNILQTEEKPGWFNAISSKYIKKFVADKSVKVAFSGKGTVNPKPEGDGIADLWIETTFHANQDVDYNFQYVVSNVGENIEIITCCHSFDISTSYIGSGLFSTSNGLQWVNFAGSETNFPGYFYTETGLNLIDRIDGGKVTYSKGIDEVTKKTRAYYSVKDGFFYLTINLNNQQCEYPSGLCGFFSPVNFSSRVYNIGFPLIIPQGSATFLQPNISNVSISQNYFLFSPWYVNSMSLVHGTGVSSSSSRYPTHLLGQRDGDKVKDVPIKSWDNHVIYKQSPEKGRSPGNPSILFADKNSVITYAMQHKALFTQRCLYAIKLNKGGSWDPLGAIGLKRYDNTNPDYFCDLVIWWNILGNDDTPYDDIKAKEYVKLEVNGKETTEELADAIANVINNKGTTMFDIPLITEDKYDYYVKY